MKKLWWLLLALPFLFLVIFIVWFGQATSGEGPLQSPQQVTITAGQGVNAIAADLSAKTVIGSDLAFKISVVLEGARNSFIPGEYTIPAKANIRKVIEILISTPEAEEVSVRIQEGWTAREIGDALEKAGVLSADAFVTAVSTPDSRTIAPDRTYDFLRDKPATANLEGYLFPDTYKFFKDATAKHVVQKFLDTFASKVSATILSDIRSQGRTVFDVVTLASIVDKEVRTDADRRIAAGVFWTRLAHGIALQSDATVNYVTGKQALQPTNIDLSTASPYNTYQNRGLPPGPIGNPSFSAIRATANPQDSDYLYFLTKPDGTTVFSKTYEEHLANKRKYLQ
ncbi:MAG: endolytic transglycosylase MltG [Patescibacteria group bacterium]|jgi:UPF0755 protein